MRTQGRTKAKIFLDKMYELLQDNSSTLLSENQIFLLVNEELEPKNRISKSYFEFLKSKSQTARQSIKNSPQFTEAEREHYLHVLELGRAKQLQNLTKGMLEDGKTAYSHIQLLKMKYPEFRDGAQNINIGSGDGAIQITVGNQEHRGLVENILAGNDQPQLEEKTEDIEHTEVDE